MFLLIVFCVVCDLLIKFNVHVIPFYYLRERGRGRETTTERDNDRETTTERETTRERERENTVNTTT